MMTRMHLLVAGTLACLALAACDSRGPGLVGPEGAPISNSDLPQPECDPVAAQSWDGGAEYVQSACPGDPDGGDLGGGGGGGGGGTTTTEFRLQGQVYPIESSTNGVSSWVKMRGWSRFEKLVGGTWQKVDAGSLSVQCSGGGTSDSDHENNAGFTDVEFWIGPALPGTYFLVQCSHTAVHNGVSYTATSTYDLRMW